jgi:hypothetical protein
MTDWMIERLFGWDVLILKVDGVSMGRFQAIVNEQKKCNNFNGNDREVYTSARIVLWERTVGDDSGSKHGE